MHFSSALFASAFLTLANGAVLRSRASLSGIATFYGGNLAGGTCSFSTYTLPSGLFGAAFPGSAWNNAANCGACVAVTGPSGTKITAMIVDECPECDDKHLDLFGDAFAKLADPKTGIIDISWTYVDCPITSALQVHNKDGVSKSWFSMQVVNANKAVKNLEVSTDGGSTWKPTTRKSYNFFENPSGFGTATVDVKITSVDGEIVMIKNVEVSSGTSATALSNFGSSDVVAPVVSSFSTSMPPDYSTSTLVAPSDTPVKVVATPATLTSANIQETVTPLPSSDAIQIGSSAAAIVSTPPPCIAATPTPTPSSSTTKTKTKKKCSKVTPSSSSATPASYAAAVETSLAAPSSYAAPASYAAGAETSLAAGNTYNPTTTAMPYYPTSVASVSSAAGGNSLSALPSTTAMPFTGAASRSNTKIESFLVALGLAVLAAF